MSQHQRWAALRRMQQGAAGRPSKEQLALSHVEALKIGILDESEKYFGHLAGWLGSVKWALEGNKSLRAEPSVDKQHLAFAHAAALEIGIKDQSEEYAGYRIGWLSAVIRYTNPAADPKENLADPRKQS